MNRKRILVWALALLVVGSSSAITYASGRIDNTKNIVVTAEKKDNANSKEQKTISNEQAIKMATEAMQSYMGKDANYFSEAKVHRLSDTIKEAKEAHEKYLKEHPEEAKKIEEARKKFQQEHPDIAKKLAQPKDEIIDVDFIPKNADENKVSSNFVSINERTGEVVNVTAINDLDENSQAQIDDNKVKDATLNFFKKIEKKLEGNTITVHKTLDVGRIFVDCKLDNGGDCKIEINVKDYSVIHYEVNYDNIKMLPDVQAKYEKDTRKILIN